jgi:hypothetical protein
MSSNESINEVVDEINYKTFFGFVVSLLYFGHLCSQKETIFENKFNLF